MVLAAAGFTVALDLLDHLPKRYEDRRRFDAFPNQATAAAVCLRGTVIDASLKHFGPGRKFLRSGGHGWLRWCFRSGKVTCRWYNMPFIQKLVATGHEVSVYGKVEGV